METREITEVKVYILALNPMRGNIEDRHIVAVSYEPEKLIDWYNKQKADEPYEEEGSGSFDVHGDSHTWNKYFKKGSILEWYNPCDDLVEAVSANGYGQGISFEWAEKDSINHNLNFV